MAMLIPVVFDRTARSWPKHDRGPAAYRAEFGYVMERPFTSDAHFGAYSAPAIARRLHTTAISRVEIAMVVAVFDVDHAHSHASTGGDGRPAPDSWWFDLRGKLSRLPSGFFAYRTRGGARVVYAIEPFSIRNDDDRSAWAERYQAWAGHLNRHYEIPADPSCCDFTRLFRVPHATRDGVLQVPECVGNPYRLGAWNPTLAHDDIKFIVVGKPRKRREPVAVAPSSYHGSGLLFYALQARGAIGQQIEPGKFAIVCPNEARHSKRTGADSSTVLWLSRARLPEVGMIWCSHAHCCGFGLKDWLRLFDRGELDAARRAAGLPERRGAA